MKEWSGEDRPIRLLFAEEDTYVLDSLVSLNLKSYLEHELRTERFQRVLFVRMSDGVFWISAQSGSAWEWVCAQNLGWFPKLGKILGNPEPGSREMRVSPDALLKLLSTGQDMAAVVEFDAFSELFRKRTKQLEQLVPALGQNRSRVLVRGSVFAENTQPFLQDPDGVFQNCEAVFPEVSEVFSEEEQDEAGWASLLQERMGSACSFLNDFSEKTVRRICTYVGWVLKQEPMGELQEALDDIIRLVRARYAAGTCTKLLNDNAAMRFETLISDLDRNWEALRNFQTARTDSEQLSDREYRPRAVANYESALRMRETAGMGLGEQDQRRCRALGRNLMIPRKHLLVQEEREQLDFLTQTLQKSALAGDRVTLNCLLDCLENAVNRKLDCPAEDWRRWTKIAESGQALFEAERAVEALKSRIELLEDQIRTGNGEIQSLKQQARTCEKLLLQKMVLQGRQEENLQRLVALEELHRNGGWIPEAEHASEEPVSGLEKEKEPSEGEENSELQKLLQMQI